MKETAEDNTIGESSSEEEDGEYSVEKVLDKHTRDNKVEYYLKWKGHTEAYNTWELEEHLNCRKLIKAFNDELKRKEENKSKGQPEH